MSGARTSLRRAAALLRQGAPARAAAEDGLQAVKLFDINRLSGSQQRGLFSSARSILQGGLWFFCAHVYPHYPTTLHMHYPTAHPHACPTHSLLKLNNVEYGVTGSGLTLTSSELPALSFAASGLRSIAVDALKPSDQ